MSRNKSFYITTTLPYVNAEPHIGFAYEILIADVIVRNKVGEEIFFSTGTDEHGQKIFDAAEKAGEKVELYVERYAQEFKKLKNLLGLSNNLKFIRTTSEDHIKAAQELWARCRKNDDIYEKEFEGLYCVGCERFLTERDIIDGKCSIHQTEPQLLKEKNWFFRLKKYGNDLLKYLENPDVVIPDWRREEAINFIKDGLEDFSISREKKRLSWGVPVPGDDAQVMYVWFDALTGYISTLGWPEDKDGNFKKFWEQGYTLQLAGKDQVRFQSLMWQAMLMSAGIKNTNQVFYHGFINSGGHKMSKSLGNVISPQDMVKRYGADGTRYLLLRHVHPTDDTDITWERLDEWYNAGLANGLGNLVSRITQLSTTYLNKWGGINPREDLLALEQYDCQKALDGIWSRIQKLDQDIAETEPFKLVKSNLEQGQKLIDSHRTELVFIARTLRPFMPDTSEIIHEAVVSNKKPENLFPRKDAQIF